MNLSDEIRKQIEKNKELKLEIGEINNHLSTLEGLVRKDIMERVDEAYQKGLEDGKAVNDNGCEGCKYQANGELTCPCSECANNFKNQWTAKDDKIEVGDEVETKNGTIFVVTKVTADNLVVGLINDGNNCVFSADRVVKTGRHFDIQKILEGMK